MGGYANRIIRLTFPEISDDQDQDLIWVTIRNPRLMPPHELVPEQVTPIVDGMPEDIGKANEATHAMMAKLIVGWHAYDASQPVLLDAVGNDTAEPVLIPQEFTAGNVARLPMEIVNRIGREMQEATNPL